MWMCIWSAIKRWLMLVDLQSRMVGPVRFSYRYYFMRDPGKNETTK